MKFSEIPTLRLQNTGLSNSPFKNPADVVEHLGAVQAQDFAAAKWTVGLRMQQATDKLVEDAFNRGEFLRTHVMRPTWHFVMPQDIKWMQELTASRVKRILAPYNQKLGITQEVLSKSQKVIAKALEGKRFLTRAELADKLEETLKTPIRGQRLSHLIVHSELDALICSGPLRGRQFTYALLDERAPNAKRLSLDEALGKLALKYFVGHGPAQVKDFAWWSGLTMKDAQQGLESAKSGLAGETVEGKTYWSPQKARPETSMGPSAFLLSVYDEYVLSYKDRSAFSEGRIFEKLMTMGNALTAVIIFRGKIVGTWKRRIIKAAHVEIELNPFVKLDPDEKEAFEKAVGRYGQFMMTSTSIALTYK